MKEKARDIDMILTLIVILFIAYLLWQPAECALLQDIITERLPPTQEALSYGFSSEPSLSMNLLAGLAGLGAQSSFRYSNGGVHKSAKGNKRIRLTQTYANYDVYGSGVAAEMDADEMFTGHMFGEVVKDLNTKIRNPDACQRNVNILQDMAIRLERLSPSDNGISQRDARRIVYAGSDATKARLAYRVQFRYSADNDIRSPVYFFDACTGMVLMNYDQINTRVPKDFEAFRGTGRRTNSSIINSGGRSRGNCPVNAAGVGGNEKIGKITYNSSPFCLNVQKTFLQCKFQGDYSEVIDNEQTERESKTDIAGFSCSNGYQDAINGAYGVANDAMYYGEIAGLLFQDKYDYQAFDYRPRLVVHYGVKYSNAFWDGQDMFFGDCDQIFHPFVDIDTVGHELAHGVITQNSNLAYTGISGGINEAFADIIGEATKHYGRNSNDWKISYDSVKEDAGFEALRYFDDPTKDGRSIKHVLGYRWRMDVHFSSGVFNYAFYRMVEKEGMDIYDATKCFHDANLNLWKPTTRFFGGACNVMQAAYDNGFSHRKVRRAFWRVGIPLIFCNYAALSSSLYAGETRERILVRTNRSPILKVDLVKRKSQTTTIRAASADNSPVRVIIGKDNEAETVIAEGINHVDLGTSPSQVYVMLTLDTPKDVNVTLTISA